MYSAYVVVADVERFIDDDPRDSFLTAWLSQRPVVRDVVVCLRNESLDRNVPHSRLLTCTERTPMHISRDVG